MSRAGKFIPGGAGRKSGPLTPGANRTGPIRAPDSPGEGPPAKGDKKPLFPKGGLRKQVPKSNRLPITIMSGVVCGLLVFAAQYILVVRPGQIREAQAMHDNAAAQQALADSQAAQKKEKEEEILKLNAARVMIKVDSKPTGASVTLGDQQQATPASFVVPPGTFQMVVHLDGYEDYKKTVKTEADKPIDLGTIPLVQLTGNLSLSSPQSDVTYVLTGPDNYSHEGTVPDRLPGILVGVYQLTAQQHDWKLLPITITVHTQENVQQAIKFPYASLVLDSVPAGATVRNGHTVLGQTPLNLKEQRPGNLRLSLDLPPYTIQWLDLNLPDFGSVSKVVTLTKDKDFIAASGIPMVWIPAGFWAGKYDVTQAQFEPVAGYNPSYFRRPNRPVENISWDNATAFCEKLTEFERKAGKLPAGYHYSLPTESQWATFSADADLDQAATSRVNSLSSTQDVGFSEPNKYGLYDTLGNVWEWCLDTVDDQGDHSLRGGSWLSSSDNFPGTDTRITAVPKNADRFSGFRVVLVPTAQ